MVKRITNMQFSNTREFANRCRKVNIKPTKRQASKFRMGKGIVYNTLIKKG